ncbi:MAG: esterase-like activity of phytase family protein [Gammaproteobacteria bacterium]|nr:esterase-like activity of phytase family protein [Gammaproteobacteria bacterium]NNM20714.1 esterase-like activity of phytase family protein [Gammaproteobacteria bacterium]
MDNQPMSSRPGCWLVLLLVCTGCAHPVTDQGNGIRLEYLGQATFPTGYEYKGTAVGGLSGIDYDPASNSYVVISDDRAARGPVRFYEVTIDLADGSLEEGDVVFSGVTSIQDRDGQSFAVGAVDPEAVRVAPDGSLLWVSEGDGRSAPFVRQMRRTGEFIAEYLPPPYYTPGARTGTRENKAFESLALSLGGKRMLAATENALKQDGPAATLENGSPVRLLVLDNASGRRQAEYIYVTDPVAEAPRPANGFATNGLVELLAIDDRQLIALERSFSRSRGNRIRLFLTDTDSAVDVAGLKSIAGHDIRTMPKQLLLDLDELGVRLDNIEGMSLGAPLPDGSRTLILVSDNNFNQLQLTQVLAFRLVE